jgi:hypothetical protein
LRQVLKFFSSPFEELVNSPHTAIIHNFFPRRLRGSRLGSDYIRVTIFHVRKKMHVFKMLFFLRNNFFVNICFESHIENQVKNGNINCVKWAVYSVSFSRHISPPRIINWGNLDPGRHSLELMSARKEVGGGGEITSKMAPFSRFCPWGRR